MITQYMDGFYENVGTRNNQLHFDGELYPHQWRRSFFTDAYNTTVLSSFTSWRLYSFAVSQRYAVVWVLSIVFYWLGVCATASVWGFVSGWMKCVQRNRAPSSTTWCRSQPFINSTFRCTISTPTSTTGQCTATARPLDNVIGIAVSCPGDIPDPRASLITALN